MKKITFSKIIGSTGVFNDGDWVESKDQDPNGEVRLIQLADIGDGIFIDKSNRFLTSEKAKQLKCTYLKEGDVLVARMPDPLGRACIFPKLDKPCVTVVDVCIIRPDSKIANNAYIKFLINSPDFRNKINRFASGTTRQRISRKNLDKISFSLPDYDTQLHIANILSKAESLITQRKESIRLLDEYLKSVFLEMFGDPVRNEKGWTTEKLSDLGTLDRGVSKNRPRNAPELLGGEYPLIQTGDIANSGLFIEKYNQTYSELGLRQSKMWPSGTLCITIAANIGKASILKFDACFPDSVVGFVTNQRKCETIFVYYLFRFLQSILEKNAPQAAQKNINLGILRKLPVPNPPKELQTKFAQIVEKTEALKTQYQQSLQELENLYGSFSQKAFKGELSIKDESLLMAAEPEVEYKKEESKLTKQQAFLRKLVLASHIVYELCEEYTFGHTKLMKLLYLGEQVGGMALRTNYKKFAAGPFDGKTLTLIDLEYQKNGWFEIDKRSFNVGNIKREATIYKKTEKSQLYQKYFNNYFAEETEIINKLISLFRNEKTQTSEIVATLYYAWKEQKANNTLVNENSLIKGFYEFHQEKKKFTKEQIKEGYDFMMEHKIYPK